MRNKVDQLSVCYHLNVPIFVDCQRHHSMRLEAGGMIPASKRVSRPSQKGSVPVTVGAANHGRPVSLGPLNTEPAQNAMAQLTGEFPTAIVGDRSPVIGRRLLGLNVRPG